MKKHREANAKDADKLGSDAEKAADHHRIRRAKELQGKRRTWPCDRAGYRSWDCNACGPCASSNWLAVSRRVCDRKDQ
jgi:hypothetical protein